MTSTFGNCARCGAPAVVKLNREPLCVEHYDDELEKTFGMIERSLDLGREGL